MFQAQRLFPALRLFQRLEYVVYWKGGKFKFSARASDLPHFIGNGKKAKIPSEIKPPLILQLSKACKKAVLRSPRMWVLKNQFSPSLKYLAHLSGFLRKKRPNLFNYSLTQERLHIMFYIIMNYDIKVSSFAGMLSNDWKLLNLRLKSVSNVLKCSPFMKIWLT